MIKFNEYTFDKVYLLRRYELKEVNFREFFASNMFSKRIHFLDSNMLT